MKVVLSSSYCDRHIFGSEYSDTDDTRDYTLLLLQTILDYLLLY